MRNVTKQVMLDFATLRYLFTCPIHLLHRISKKNIKGNTCATWLSMEHSREKGDEKGGFLVAFMKATPTQ